MNSRLIFSTLRQLQKFQKAGVHNFPRIGNREIVGFGFNGIPSYMDRTDFPMPAVRFRENTPDIKALHEKEKGDWKKLTLDEKKALYRASFCLTFAEIEAPTGKWKSIMGLSCLIITAAMWIVILEKIFVYRGLPPSFSKESKEAQLRYIIAAEMNPIQGIASKWDYEKEEWKKK